MSIDGGTATLLAAFISGVVSPILVLYFKRRWEDRQAPEISGVPRETLVGRWRGTADQYMEDDNPMRFEITAKTKLKGKVVAGYANFKNPIHNNADVIVSLYDGCFADNILIIRYKNEDPHVIQRGALCLELDGHGKELKGQFAGYSPTFKKIIAGKVEFKKVGAG